MKKTLIIISTCLFLLTACNNQQNTSIVEQLSETTHNKSLESLIINYYKIPASFYGQTAYYYNYIDLNNDDIDEIIAVLIGPYMSESGGNPAIIVTQTDNQLDVFQHFTCIHTPLIISDETTNGFKDIITLKSYDDGDSEYVVLTYQGDAYTSVKEAHPLKSLDNISGQSIISNATTTSEDDEPLLTLE